MWCSASNFWCGVTKLPVAIGKILVRDWRYSSLSFYSFVKNLFNIDLLDKQIKLKTFFLVKILIQARTNYYSARSAYY